MTNDMLFPEEVKACNWDKQYDKLCGNVEECMAANQFFIIAIQKKKIKKLEEEIEKLKDQIRHLQELSNSTSPQEVA